MSHNYHPTPAQRKSKRTDERNGLHLVEPNGSTEWQKLVNTKIFFWSWSLTGVNENTRSKYFIFHTVDDIGFFKVRKLLTKQNPDLKISRWTPFKYNDFLIFSVPYTLSHAIEVITPTAITWLEFMELITLSLRGVL